MLNFAIAAVGSLSTSGWNNHMWGAGWGWWMALMMMGFWGAAIWLVVSLTRRGGGRSAREGDSLTRARTLLSERLARGEIDTNEYRERLDALG